MAIPWAGSDVDLSTLHQCRVAERLEFRLTCLHHRPNGDLKMTTDSETKSLCEDEDLFKQRRRRSGTWPRTRSLNAPSPIHQFGPCGRIMKNSAMVIFDLFSIDTDFVTNEEEVKTGEWKKEIKNVATKPGPGFHVTVDNQCNLYAGLNSLDAVAIWNTEEPRSSITLLDYSKNFDWVDAFSIDGGGRLRFLGINMQNYFLPYLPLELDGKMKIRLYKLKTGALSYF